MRDRLGCLHQAQKDSEGFTTMDLDTLSENEASSHTDRDIDGVLQEAQQIRLEIQRIQSDISELEEVNRHTLNRTSLSAATKRGSNAIAVEIKRRGETVLQRLQKMNALREELEVRRGGSDPAARIARTQYQCLRSALREVMFSYNEAEMSHREACRRQIQRQMEVVGREVSEEELEEVLETGELNVFSPQVEGKTARSAFLQIESRHTELMELEQRMEGIRELLLGVALLVEEQGAAAASIQRNVQTTEVMVVEAVVQLENAVKSDKKNPFKCLFCGCFPCFNR